MASQEGNELTRTESYQYPSAHVGHLSPGQQGALDRFKELCQQKGYWKPAQDGHLATHDDETLLRYLRARKFVPNEAFAQFKDTEDWRKQNQIVQLYETIDIQEYDQTRRLYPQWLGRTDKRGIPVYLFEVAHLDSKKVSAFQNSSALKNQAVNSNVSPKMLRLFALYENLTRFALPLCSTLPNRPNPETPVSQSNNIVDISGVGLRQFWNLKAHMQDASVLATAHYPETLDRIFIIGAPSFFPTVWGWIKRWFDPVTVSKIFILSPSEVKPTLHKYMDIDSIPKQYGGNLEFKFGDLPKLDPTIVKTLRWTGEPHIPIGPIRWEYNEDGDLAAVAVGTENGVQRKKVIATVTPDPNVAQMSFDGASDTKKSIAPKQPSNGDANLNVGKSTGSALPTSSRAGTYTVPYRDDTKEVAHPPVDSRQGTSSTRFEQQAGTHAQDTLKEGTPAVHRDGQGEKQAVMEPNTVGQAPKEHPMPQPEEPQPSVIDQAKDYAGQAVEQAQQLPQTVMAAVGMGGEKKAEETTPTSGRHLDPAVDDMDPKNVEEFLRAKTMTKPQA